MDLNPLVSIYFWVLASEVFPSAKVLMSYFHLKTNNRKNLLSNLGELYDDFISDVTRLHYSNY